MWRRLWLTRVATAGCLHCGPLRRAGLLAAAEPYGGDVDNERHLLEEHLRRLLDAARAELAAVLRSENSRELEAVLDKYKGYPPEVLDGPWAEVEVRKEELRRAMVRRRRRRPCAPGASAVASLAAA